MQLDIETSNAKNFLAKQKDGSINCFLVSVPFGSMRKYHGFSYEFEPIADLMAVKLAEGGCICFNEMDQQKAFNFSGDSFRHALYFRDILKLNFLEQVVVQKNAFVFPRRNYGVGYVNHEYLWVFSKGRVIPRPIVDRPNKKSGLQGEGTSRNADDETTRRNGHKYIIQPYGKRGSCWGPYEVGGAKTHSISEGKIDHPAKMNLQLAIDALKTWGGDPSKSVVCDCFVGSGTSGVAAKKLGFKKFLGCDVSKDYCVMARRRIQAVK